MYRFTIQIHRNGGTMLVGMIIPGVLVAFLGTLYYLLPRGTGERISYLASILLTEIMFIVMVTQVVPLTKDIPGIALLFLYQTIMLAIVMIIVVSMDKIQTRQDRLLQRFKDQIAETQDPEVSNSIQQEEEGDGFEMKPDKQGYTRLSVRVVSEREKLIKK